MILPPPLARDNHPEATWWKSPIQPHRLPRRSRHEDPWTGLQPGGLPHLGVAAHP